MLVRAAITEYNRLMFEEGRDSTEPRIDKHGRAAAFFQEVNHPGAGVDSNLFLASDFAGPGRRAKALGY